MNTIVTNNTGLTQVVKSKKISTNKVYDSDGKLISEETVEEIEYVEPSKTLTPAYDPYRLLKDSGQWWQRPIVTWSSSTADGNWEYVQKDS